MKHSADPDLLLLQAAADPTRLAILRQLAGASSVCACDFTAGCGVAQPTVSHHLRVLRESGWVTTVRRGTWIYYSLRPEAAASFTRIAQALAPGAPVAPMAASILGGAGEPAAECACQPAEAVPGGAVAREAPVMSGTAKPALRVLFVCTGNSARSQMAEALLSRAGGPAVEVSSAGTDPKGVNPYTFRALAELGIDWSGAGSKSVGEFLGRRFDYVITVCDNARQACPVFPGRHARLHWDVEDPAEVEGTDEKRLAAFRAVREELAAQVERFVAEALRS